MKLAIIASNEAEKAQYLYDFFKEGNRITVDALLTDNPESPVAQKMRAEGIDVIFLADPSLSDRFARLLKERGVELLVVDDFNSPLPEGFKEEFGEAIVYPAHKESAPLEVIETANRLKAVAAAPVQPQPRATVSPKAEQPEQKEAAPTVEDEWAEALDIQQEPAGEPQQPQQPQQPPQYPYGPQQQFQQPQQQFQQQPQQPPQYPYGPQQFQRPTEPMPETYLVWSVIITILCCLIPGIIAIIYSASVSSKYYQGNLEGAKRASRMAQIWCIVSVVTGIIWATLYLPLALFVS